MNPTTLTAADLVAAIDEERMAHDVYVVAAQRWNLPLFLNIAAAETRHAGAFDALAASAKFTLPPAQAGAYSTADIQRLHDQLLPLVNSSLATALKAGALIEETSIVDVRRCMRAATDEPTRNVLAQLDRASRQHLSAFVRHLQSLGETYRPHILSPEEFATAMVAQPMPGRGPGYRGGR